MLKNGGFITQLIYMYMIQTVFRRLGQWEWANVRVRCKTVDTMDRYRNDPNVLDRQV